MKWLIQVHAAHLIVLCRRSFFVFRILVVILGIFYFTCGSQIYSFILLLLKLFRVPRFWTLLVFVMDFILCSYHREFCVTALAKIIVQERFGFVRPKKIHHKPTFREVKDLRLVNQVPSNFKRTSPKK